MILALCDRYHIDPVRALELPSWCMQMLAIDTLAKPKEGG